MTQFETFRFLLALIVFVLLTASFTAFIVYSIKVTLKLIKHGAEDKKITKEYIKYGSKKHGCTGCVSNAVYAIASATIAVVMIVALVFSLVVQFNEGRVCTNLPLMNVVNSGSMSYVNEKNENSYGKGYTDQMQVHDLIFTHVLPEEKDLKVGDIVVYEVDNAFLIHRIVAIEEPNDKHPNERHFLLQGDANERPDRFPVRYSQMKSIYKGQRIAFVGSFITFMQSPAGWLCVLLVVFAVVATPIAERKLAKAKYARLVEIGVIVENKPQNNNPSDDNNPDDSKAASMADVVEQADSKADSAGAELETEPVAEKDEDDNDEDDETVAVVADRFGSFGEGKTFAQKLEEADDILAYRYAQISALLGRIEKVRVIRGKKRESYSKGRNAVAKLAIRGKTLNVYLGLDPNDYVGTKYRFVDKTDSKTYQKTPMQLKLTSDRQTKWAKELIADLVAKYGWTLLDEQAQAELVGVVAELEQAQAQAQAEPASVGEEAETEPVADFVEQADSVEEVVQDEDEQEEDNQEEIADETVAVVANRFGSFGEGKTFAQKLEEADDVLAGRYAQISALLGRIKKVRVIRGKKRESYSKGRNAVAKLVIRGKTLNVYLGLDPNDYVGTKYRFVDKTDSKTYQKTPMQLKLTSDRQTKWAKELIADLVAKYGWTLLDEVVEPVGVASSVEQAEPASMVDVVEQDEVVADFDEECQETAEIVEQAEPASMVEQEPVAENDEQAEEVVEPVEQAEPASVDAEVETEPVAEKDEECQDLSNDDEQAQELEQDLQRLREYRNNLSEQDRAEFDSFADPDADVSDRGIDLVVDFIVANEQARRAEQAEPASVGEDVEQEPVEDVVEEQPEDVDQQEPQNEPQQANDVDELAVDNDDNVVCDDKQTADNVIDGDPATEQAQPDCMANVVDNEPVVEQAEEQAQPDCMANVVDNESAEEQAEEQPIDDVVEQEPVVEQIAEKPVESSSTSIIKIKGKKSKRSRSIKKFDVD